MESNTKRPTKARKPRAAIAVAVASPRPKPTEKELRNIILVSKVFARAQFSKTSHASLIAKLTTIYNELPLEEFVAAFTSCLKVPFKASDKHGSGHRTLEFACGFCIAVNKNEDEEDTGDLCQFLVKIFTFLLDNSNADDTNTRFHIVQFVHLLLSGLGQEAGLDEWLADRILLSMNVRLKDKSAPIRAQAVVAMQRLQEPTDPNCKVIKEFLYHLENDPSPDVRCSILQCIARSQATIPAIYARHLDVRDKVRRDAFLVLSRIHINSMRMYWRENILMQGLRDPAVMVRNSVESVLIPAWFACLDKEYLRFLRCMDLGSPNGALACQLALDALIKNASLDSLLDYMNQHLLGKVVPVDQLWTKLGTEKAFLWRSLVAHLRSEGLDESVDSILPDLTPFCAYIRQCVLDNEVVPESSEQHTLITIELLKMTQGYDLADEMGRSSLSQLVLDMLVSRRVDNSVIPHLLEVMCKVQPNVNARLQKLAELISDIHVPLDQTATAVASEAVEQEFAQHAKKRARLRMRIMEVASDQECAVEVRDFALAQELDTELNALRGQLEEVNQALSTCDHDSQPARQESNDPETLIKCLSIVYEMMQSPSVTCVTPQLRSLNENFVSRFYVSETCPRVRAWCLKCFACFCLLDREFAAQKIPVFYTQLANGEENTEIGVFALKSIFDLFLCFGLANFQMEDNIDLVRDSSSGRSRHSEVFESSNSSGSSEKRSVEVDVLQTLFNIFNDTECPLLHPVATEGFCKLLLSGRINSYMLVSRLMTAWFNPALTDKYMKQTLGVFFSGYTSNSVPGLTLMGQSLVPTLETLLSAPLDSPLLDVDISSVAGLIINITKRGINPKTTLNVHNNMAVTLCDKILSNPKSELVSFLAQALSRLDVTYVTDEQIDSLVELAKQVGEALWEDKQSAKFVKKFYTMVCDRKSVNASAETTEADTTVQTTTSDKRRTGSMSDTDTASQSSRRSSIDSLLHSTTTTLALDPQLHTIIEEYGTNSSSNSSPAAKRIRVPIVVPETSSESSLSDSD